MYSDSSIRWRGLCFQEQQCSADRGCDFPSVAAAATCAVCQLLWLQWPSLTSCHSWYTVRSPFHILKSTHTCNLFSKHEHSQIHSFCLDKKGQMIAESSLSRPSAHTHTHSSSLLSHPSTSSHPGILCKMQMMLSACVKHCQILLWALRLDVWSCDAAAIKQHQCLFCVI